MTDDGQTMVCLTGSRLGSFMLSSLPFSAMALKEGWLFCVTVVNFWSAFQVKLPCINNNQQDH